MTDRKKLELRQSQIRSRLAELGSADASAEGGSEIRTLSTEYASNEGRIEAFMVSDDVPEVTVTERNEKAELYSRASVGDLVFALVNGQSGVKGGAMAELQAEQQDGRPTRFTCASFTRRPTP